ncbi:unnamed protein product [Rodentolepis nana]|uniref:SERPIN domain-containing protein n=1 Tax=Rodentolepis nana TaxID=102285 RepID=A0A0R3TG22_RODNA|nr:unnamed protein product [Rodentolepis nana]VDO01868.1 unnamed protein product [Rodentolepis nana]
MSKEELFASESFIPFVQHLYAHLKPSHEKENLFFSPLSIYSSLALALCGATEQTHHGIAHTLFVKTAHLQDYAYTLQHLGDRIKEIKASDKLDTLKLANGIFCDAGFEVNPHFTKEVQTYFHAEGKQVDFASNHEKSRQTINEWVEMHTEKKIKELLPSDSIDNSTRLVLANAIYFKGTWEKVFHRDLTHEAPFHTLDGKEVTVPMMKDNGVYEAYEFNEISATCVKIPFKTCHMLIVLPNDKKGLPCLLKDLLNMHHPSHFNALFKSSNYQKSRYDLILPKFKLGANGKCMDLKGPVSQMGAAHMFDQSKAKFERITTKERLYVSAMVHKAMIEVNEEGAEAAAATGMSIMPMSLVPCIAADHPFLFFIVTDNEFPVFAGHVMNPLEE